VIALGAAILGTVFMAGDWWFEAFAVPRLAEVDPSAMDTFTGGQLLAGGLTSFVLFGIGWALYGIASLRARVYPVAISWAIIVGGFVSGVSISIIYVGGGLILGLAFIGLGTWLAVRSRRSAIAPEAVTPTAG
jgi:hypothetical protein